MSHSAWISSHYRNPVAWGLMGSRSETGNDNLASNLRWHVTRLGPDHTSQKKIPSFAIDRIIYLLFSEHSCSTNDILSQKIWLNQFVRPAICPEAQCEHCYNKASCLLNKKWWWNDGEAAVIGDRNTMCSEYPTARDMIFVQKMTSLSQPPRRKYVSVSLPCMTLSGLV